MSGSLLRSKPAESCTKPLGWRLAPLANWTRLELAACSVRAEEPTRVVERSRCAAVGASSEPTPSRFRDWFVPGSERDGVVNPNGPVKQRAREFGRGFGPEGGRAALSCDFRRTLTPMGVAVSGCQNWRKTRNAGSGRSRRCALTGGSRESSRLEEAPPVGLEPTTQRLTAACSTS